MDISLVYFSLLLLGGYTGLRRLAWKEADAERKRTYGLKDLRTVAGNDCSPVKSAYWTRELIQIDRKI